MRRRRKVLRRRRTVDEGGTVSRCYNVSLHQPRRCRHNFARLQCWLLTDFGAYRIWCRQDLTHIQFGVGRKLGERDIP